MNEKKYKVTIVRTLEALLALNLLAHQQLVADVETYRNVPQDGKLLGVALAPLDGSKFADGSDAAYVVVQEYLFNSSRWQGVWDQPMRSHLGLALHSAELVGHNYCYDRAWLNHEYSPLQPLPVIYTRWHADTRLMWHMSTAAVGPRPYALKDAQVEVLGWDVRGDQRLEEQVRERGGSLKKGDHYLADTDVLGYYAGLDAISTALLYHARKPFFDQHDQWALLAKMMRASAHLYENTSDGVRCDAEKLSKQVDQLAVDLLQSRKDLVSAARPYVTALVHSWRDHQAARYASEKHRHQFLQTPSRWKKFNPGSDPQKRELFFRVMKLPVVEYVKPRKDKKTGRKVRSTTPSTSLEAVEAAVRASKRQDLGAMLDAYRRSEKTETLLKNFASKWLKALRYQDGSARIHPPFNPCGTVTYRISGYKPYFLNLPFEEHDLMSCFSCDPGWHGVHADLVSVEPCVTAHYSQDPGLLKVFRDGLGDVYLDLALTLWPRDLELRSGYDPCAVCTSEVKERFKVRRKPAKIVQLAVQYTGTEFTVSKNLGCSLEEGARLVDGYWKHFAAVARMNEQMKRLHRKRGYIRNAVGRVLRVPEQCEKDLPNRVIQSSGHDILTFWALRIYELCAQRKIQVRPVLWDCHDSSSNQSPDPDALAKAYVDALDDVNTDLGMTVPVRAEVKRFTTLAGLKGSEQ